MVEVEDSVAAKKKYKEQPSAAFFLALLGLVKPHQPGIAKT